VVVRVLAAGATPHSAWPVRAGDVVLRSLGEPVDERRAPLDGFGRAVFEALPPGTWLASFDAPNRALQRRHMQHPRPAHRAAGATPVRVTAGEQSEVTLSLRDLPLADVTVTWRGRPAAGIAVGIAPTAPELAVLYQLISLRGAVATDARGRAVVPAGDAGPHVVYAACGSRSPVVLARVGLAPGRNPIALELGTASVEGRVADTLGRALANAEVRLVPLDPAGLGQARLYARSGGPSGGSGSFALGEGYTRTDAAGHYRFPCVPPGLYELAAAALDHDAPATAPGAFLVRTNDELLLPDLELPPRCRLHGRVAVERPGDAEPAVGGLQPADGAPAPRGKRPLLVLRGLDGARDVHVVVGADGAYEVDGVQPGRYRPELIREHVVVEGEPFAVERAGSTRHDLVFER